MGNWVVNFDDQQCIASHLFDSKRGRTTLAFRPLPTTPNFDVLVEAQGVAPTIDAERGKVEFGGRTLDAEWLTVMRSAKPGFSIFSFRTKREDLVELATAQRLRVSSPKLHVDLPVTELNGVMQMLDRCVADLLVQWGLSEQDQARLVSFPIPKNNIASYVANDDYPSSAIVRGAQGQVDARVTISPDGRASDCQMVRSSGHDDLDQITCKVVVERARFKPAQDREGHAMTSPFLFTIQWIIPSG